MWNVCAWLCPKRKHRQAPYDVHQETFQMDEHIGDLGDPDPEQKINKQEPPQESTQGLVVASRPEREQDNQSSQLDEKKYIEQKNKIEQEMIEEPKPVQPEKPKPKYNILPSKIKKKVNLDDYRFLQQSEEFKVKKLGSLNQQQFNIDKCKNCTFFVFDITANVYIDDTENCFIFVAPCESTIFVRNCKNLVIVAATGQFRTYQCHDCYFSLFCKSQPVIESSSNLEFSSFTCPEYTQLFDQFLKIKLFPWNNNWNQIHNFTPKEGEQHHTLSKLPTYDRQIDWTRAFKEADLQMINQRQKCIPFIQGKLPLEQDVNKALLIFSPQSSADDRCIVNWLNKNNVTLLKAHKNIFDGHKQKIVVLQIVYDENWDLDLTEVGDPTMIIDAEQIEQKSTKYFIHFGDER